MPTWKLAVIPHLIDVIALAIVLAVLAAAPAIFVLWGRF